MKKLLIFLTIFALAACDDSNDDGSSKSTYSSCKITSSQALFADDRDNDLKQCWDASGDGYESQGDAMQWCERQVNTYIDNQYLIGHTVSYAVESTNCK
ncbi:hypothetical protein ACXJY6_02050 [Vibrio sp. RC27]